MKKGGLPVFSAFFLWTVILSAALTSTASASAAERGIAGFSVGVRSGGALGLTDSPIFPMKAQAGWELGLLADFPLFPPLAGGLALGYHQWFPSDLSAGFLYRGHSGAELALYLSAKALLWRVAGRLDVLAGLEAGASSNFDRYSLTELYFFYPGVLMQPFLEFHFRMLGANTLILILPLELYFRKDLDLSASFGLGVQWRRYLVRKEQGR